jgi:uncharacterized protein YndB with AHSA1/START domain
MVRQNSNAPPKTIEQPTVRSSRTLGTVAREVSHGRTTIVLTWDFAQGVARVWELITSPAMLKAWAPYTADHDLSHVGRAVLSMIGADGAPDVEIPSVVLVADAPRLLEHSWASDMLLWKLAPAGSGCRLTLHQTLEDETMASAIAAGWHLCLDVAASIIGGNPTPAVRGMDAMDHGWRELNERYATALGVAPSQVGR